MIEVKKLWKHVAFAVGAGALMWSIHAVGRMHGEREGRSDVEARWAHARAVTQLAQESEARAPASNALGAAIASMGTCVDQGPSESDAPHFCRVGSDRMYVTAVHWWGPQNTPTRATVSFAPLGDGARDNLSAAVDMMRFAGISFVTQLAGNGSVPSEFWNGVTRNAPAVTLLANGHTMAVNESWIGEVPFVLTVDVTVAE